MNSDLSSISTYQLVSTYKCVKEIQIIHFCIHYFSIWNSLLKSLATSGDIKFSHSIWIWENKEQNNLVFGLFIRQCMSFDTWTRLLLWSHLEISWEVFCEYFRQCMFLYKHKAYKHIQAKILWILEEMLNILPSLYHFKKV